MYSIEKAKITNSDNTDQTFLQKQSDQKITICIGMIRCLKGSVEKANIVIIDEADYRSSIISVNTICHFKTTIFTP